MPEGPEVRRVYEDLRQEIGDSQVTQLQVFSGRFLKKRPVGLDQVVLPSRVVDGGVKGKFMWLEFQTGATMWITLGMSGYWSTELAPHSHFGIGIEDTRSLYFVDQRRFGTLKFSHDRAELNKKLASLGGDPLNDAEFTMLKFNQAIRKYPNKTIVEVLMNQKVCAGVGNYIKCEESCRLHMHKVEPVFETTRESVAKRASLYLNLRSIHRNRIPTEIRLFVKRLWTAVPPTGCRKFSDKYLKEY